MKDCDICPRKSICPHKGKPVNIKVRHIRNPSDFFKVLREISADLSMKKKQKQPKKKRRIIYGDNMELIRED